MKKITALLCTLFTLSIFAQDVKIPASSAMTDENAPHYLSKVSKEGTLIAMEDESQWVLPAFDTDEKDNDEKNVALTWFAGDPLMITPNITFLAYFSSYTYTIHNLRTGTYTGAKLYYGPRIDGAFTKQVTEINLADGTTSLSDGSSWIVSTASEPKFSKWQIGDYIIIGNSNKKNKNILININLNQYIESANYN
ncbi:MAG: hypothetical protein V4489_10280 [Chlamydiota bacterium]